jgi:acetyl-CoA acetyltransferase
MTLRRAAIVSPLRTPVGKFLGSLASVSAGDLGAVIIRALVDRTGIAMAKPLVSRAGHCSPLGCRSAFRGINSTAAAVPACNQ